MSQYPHFTWEYAIMPRFWSVFEEGVEKSEGVEEELQTF